MRRAALGMLAASSLAGCNLVFGLKETSPNPDGPPADVAGTPIHLTLLQLLLDSNGAPTTPTEIGIPDLVKLEAMRLDGSAPVGLTAIADGTIGVPPEITMGSWALVYQRKDSVVREIQNPPVGAHLVETLLGPVTRATPDPQSGFVITPASYPVTASHSLNRVLTTGTWTEGNHPVPPTGAALDYDFADAVSYSGLLGAPSPGDRGVLADFAIANGCRTSTGTSDFPAGDIGPPKVMTPGTAWVSSATGFTITTDLALVLTGDVAPLGETTRATQELLGYVPSKDMPAFTRPPDISRSVSLPNPPMFAVRSCSLPYQGTPPSPVLATWLDARLPRAAYTEISASRQLSGGATLVNGLGILTLSTAASFMVTTDVAFAANVKLTSSAGAADLFDPTGSDDVKVTRGGDPLTVSWDKQTATTTAQFWEVALIEVVGGSLLPRRVYVTTSTSVKIQSRELEIGRHYVFSITAYTGRGGAATGDYRTITGTQAISIIHPRSFTAK